VLLFFVLIYNKTSLKLNAKSFSQFLFGGIIIGLHWITFFYAIKITNVSITLAALSTGAFFTSFLEPLILKKKLETYEIILSLLTVIGIIIIFNVEPSYAIGISVALLSAFLSSLFTVTNAIFVTQNSAKLITFYELLFAALFISVIILFNDGFSIDFFTLSQTDWIYIFILGSICTAYALTASAWLLKKISPFSMMLTINLEPVYGIILALLVFGSSEKMTTHFYYGAILIFSTVILNGYLKNKKI